MRIYQDLYQVLLDLVDLAVVVVVLKMEELVKLVDLVGIGLQEVETQAIVDLADLLVKQLLDLVIALLGHLILIQSKELICKNI